MNLTQRGELRAGLDCIHRTTPVFKDGGAIIIRPQPDIKTRMDAG
jgi:hypothetical protein